MAQNDFEERIRQAESGGRRYGKDGKLLTSPKGAEGEMQVMPKTQRDPGYGVTPAKGRNPDEIARVGRDYLAAMEKKYGDQTLAAIAYNMGPGATDKWIAAGSDFSKLPKETQNYVQKVMGKTPEPRPTEQATTEPTEAEKIMTPALKSGMTADLGAGYKAALALSFLGSEDDDLPTTDEELRERLDKSFEERMAEAESAKPRFNALAGLDLQALSAVPPMAKPVQMNEGGEVGEEEPPVKAIRSANKMTMGDRQIENLMVGLGIDQATLGVSLDKMKMGEKENLAKNLMAMYNAKFGDVGVNAALIRPMDAPQGTYMGSLGASYPVGDGQIRAGVNAMRTPEGETRTTGHNIGYSGKVGPGYLDAQIMQPKGFPQGRSAQLQYRMQFGDGGDVKTPMLISVPLYAETVSHEMYPDQGGQYDQKDAARHMLAAGTLQRKYGETAAEMLGKLHEIKTSPLRWLGSKLGISEMPDDYEQDLHNNRVGIELGKRSKSQRELEDLVMREAQRARNEQSPGTPWIGKPVKRADGSPEEGEIGPYIGNPNIRRQGEAARRLAAMRDVNALPDPKTYAAVTGFLGVRPDEMGFSVLHPQYKEIQRVAEPAFMAGTAAQIAPALGPVIRGAGKMAGSALNERMLAGESLVPGMSVPPPVAFAVKPRGGTFATSGSLSAPQISKFDSLLDEYAAQMKKAMPNAPEELINDFVDKKVRKYFTTSYGTANDPIRLNIKSGELPLYGRDADTFAEYLLAAANNPNAPGHAQAKRHLEQRYDELANMEARVFTGGDKNFEKTQAERERLAQLMTQEGVPQEFQNALSVTSVTPKDIVDYPSSYATYGKMITAEQEGRLPSSQQFAMQNQQTIYDVKNPMFHGLSPKMVAENISVLPLDKLKNMSFEQAVTEGAKIMQPRRDYLLSVDRAEKGLSVPKEVLSMFTKPEVKTPTGEWVRITDPLGTQLEGKLMKHSVGGYSTSETYGLGGPEAFKSGKAQIYSLRNDKTQLPEVTVEAEKTDKGLTVSQIRGPYNSFPSHKAEDIFQLIKERSDFDKLTSGYYTKDNVGKDLDKPIRVEWAKSYANWENGVGNDWVVVRDDPGGIEYIWGLAQGKASGGLIERQNTDNRRYM